MQQTAGTQGSHDRIEGVVQRAMSPCGSVRAPGIDGEGVHRPERSWEAVPRGSCTPA